MSPRKYAPLLLSALLLTGLLLVYISESMDWDWNRTSLADGTGPVMPASGERTVPQESELHISVSLSSEDFGLLEARTDAFMNRYPHIRVHLANEIPSSNRYEAAVERSVQGSAPDVMLVDNGWVIPLAVQGFLKPIDSLMSGDVLSDQLPGLLEPLKWNGYLWGVPKEIDPYLIIWNKALLKQHGLTKPPGDWSALLVLGDQIAASTESDSGGDSNKRVVLTSFSPGDLMQLLLWMARFDAKNGSMLQLHSISELRQSMLTELEARSGIVAAIPYSQTQELNRIIAEDRILMMMLPWNDYNKLSESAQDKLVVEQEAIPDPWLSGSSFVVGASTKYEEDAMLWIQEMTNVAIGLEELESERKLPVRASLYSSQNGLLTHSGDMPPNWWFRALSDNSSDKTSYGLDPDWPIRWKAWQSAWSAASQSDKRFETFAQAIEGMSHHSK